MTGYQELRSRAALIDLSARGLLRATGDDRARLLHAMSTNDVQHLAPGDGLYAFFLNDKGRILMDASIYNNGSSLLLDTEPETRSKLFEHLDRYIIADDVTLEDESAAFAKWGIEGPDSLAIAAELSIPLSDSPFSLQTLENGAFTTRTTVTGLPGFRLFLPISEQAAWTERFTAAHLVTAAPDAVRTVRLENGVPRYGDEISERYLVQETQIPHAIHWNKGCYLGQEIVERVRSRGQVHRLLTPLRLPGQEPPPPGTKFEAPDGKPGEIASAAYSPALNQVVALAYLRNQ